MLLIKRIKPFILNIVLLMLVSCSGSVPEIGQLVWQINFIQKGEESSSYMELSVFTMVNDEDGISDIDKIYIINDEAELFWVLDSNSWEMKVISSGTWLGSNSIRMNDYSNLPSGTYRVLVIDKAGERDSRIFYISTEMLDSIESNLFPKILIDNTIQLESKFQDNTLWVYDDSMNIIQKYKINNGIINKSIINSDTSNKARWISIYAFDSESGTGLIKGPYPFNN